MTDVDAPLGTAVNLFLDGLNNTPALDLAIRGWAEINEKGFGDGTLNCYASLKAVLGYAMNGRDRLPVGVITFDYDTMLRRVWAFQVYVLPEFRGRGIYTAMFAELVRYGTDVLNANSIQMGTHLRNAAMRAVAKRTGCFEECIILRFNLE